jgi:hypothetical protein
LVRHDRLERQKCHLRRGIHVSLPRPLTAAYVAIPEIPSRSKCSPSRLRATPDILAGWPSFR